MLVVNGQIMVNGISMANHDLGRLTARLVGFYLGNKEEPDCPNRISVDITGELVRLRHAVASLLLAHPSVYFGPTSRRALLPPALIVVVAEI